MEVAASCGLTLVVHSPEHGFLTLGREFGLDSKYFSCLLRLWPNCLTSVKPSFICVQRLLALEYRASVCITKRLSFLVCLYTHYQNLPKWDNLDFEIIKIQLQII